MGWCLFQSQLQGSGSTRSEKNKEESEAGTWIAKYGIETRSKQNSKKRNWAIKVETKKYGRDDWILQRSKLEADGLEQSIDNKNGRIKYGERQKIRTMFDNSFATNLSNAHQRVTYV